MFEKSTLRRRISLSPHIRFYTHNLCKLSGWLSLIHIAGENLPSPLKYYQIIQMDELTASNWRVDRHRCWAWATIQLIKELFNEMALKTWYSPWLRSVREIRPDGSICKSSLRSKSVESGRRNAKDLCRAIVLWNGKVFSRSRGASRFGDRMEALRIFKWHVCFTKESVLNSSPSWEAMQENLCKIGTHEP